MRLHLEEYTTKLRWSHRRPGAPSVRPLLTDIAAPYDRSIPSHHTLTPEGDA